MKGNRQDYDQNEKQRTEETIENSVLPEHQNELKGTSLKRQVLNSIHGGEQYDEEFNRSQIHESQSSFNTTTNEIPSDESVANETSDELNSDASEPVFRSRVCEYKEEKLDGNKMMTRRKEDKVVRKIVWAIVAVLTICVIISGISFYQYWQSGMKPLNPSNKKLVQIEVPIGSSNKEIGQILQKNDVIKSGFVFTYFVKMNNLSNFQGGFYQMSPNMTLESIANMLQQGGTAEPEALADAKLAIPEGYTVDQVGDVIEKQTKFSKQEFLEFMKDESFFNELAEKYPNLLDSSKESTDVRYRLEGYLFPATYNYYEKQSLADIVTPMVEQTDTVLSSKYEEIRNKGLSVQQVLTLASLVEKEGVNEEDRRNIAQVFFNRIQEDMPLQSDIAVLYALNEQKVHLSNKDTQVDSPYNLYVHKGYGPGPFDNPGKSSIDAVLYPAENDYLYFLADIKDHKVYFAKTYEEHLEQKQQYIEDKK